MTTICSCQILNSRLFKSNRNIRKEEIEKFHKYSRLTIAASILPSLANNFRPKPNTDLYEINTLVWYVTRLLESVPRKALEKEKQIELYLLDFMNDFPVPKMFEDRINQKNALSRFVYLLSEMMLEKIVHKCVNNKNCPPRILRRLIRTMSKTLLFSIPTILAFYKILPENTTIKISALREGCNCPCYLFGAIYFCLFKIFMEEIIPEIGGEFLIRGWGI